MNINPQYQRLEKIALENNFKTVASLLQKIGIAKTNAYYIRDNKQQLSIKTALKISELLGNVSAEWLITGEGNKSNEPQTTTVCNSCLEKDKIIEDLRELNFFLRENFQRLKKELDELQQNKDEKARKTA